MIGATVKMLGFGFDDMQVAWIGEGYEALCGKRVTKLPANGAYRIWMPISSLSI